MSLCPSECKNYPNGTLYSCLLQIGHQGLHTYSRLGDTFSWTDADALQSAGHPITRIFTPGDSLTVLDDPVNHPSHYNSHPSGIECIVIARWHTFAVGNALKYMWRAGLKVVPGEERAKEIEDLKKAVWYLQDEIKRLENPK